MMNSPFDLPPSSIYLLSHSLGPVPRGAREAMLAYLERWRHHTSEDAWAAEWWQLSAEVGDRIARVLGAAPGTVSIQPSATAALAAAVSCFEPPPRERPRVVTTALDFPSMGYFWQARSRLGFEVMVVPSDDGITVPLGRILDAIDPRTCLVALSHVSYRGSYRVAVEPIVERAREVGARVVLDVYQSAGVVALDLGGWGVDFALGGSIKWLCGGPALGFLYVRPELVPQLSPALTGWIAHARPFAFAPDHEYDPTVRRFAQGTPSIPALYSCRPGLDLVLAAGVPAIARDNRRRTQRLVARAQERGWRLTCPADPEQRGGTVTIGVEDGPRAVAALARRGAYVDCRPGAGLRISPHFFNTDDEVEAALEALAEVVE